MNEFQESTPESLQTLIRNICQNAYKPSSEEISFLIEVQTQLRHLGFLNRNQMEDLSILVMKADQYNEAHRIKTEWAEISKEEIQEIERLLTEISETQRILHFRLDRLKDRLTPAGGEVDDSDPWDEVL